jgi:glycosyltransferase involved in cell wall biosynthesis
VDARRDKHVVWHVTEAMGGGISTAVHQYVRATPEFEHHLVGCLRTRHQTGEQQMFSQVRSTAFRGPLGLATIVLRSRRWPAPDIVHVHSTWAGLLGRVLLHHRRIPVVYSPHAYYFERTDISALRRWAARRLERALGRWTDTVVAVSPHEARLAADMGCRAEYVPNVAALPDLADRPSPRLVTVGRVEEQKDPRFFAATMTALRAMGVEVDPLWVGAGDRKLEAVLRSSGVRVTGWVTRQQALAEVRSADVYIHTAAWEGSPLTVLEAEALGLPVIVRSIPAMVSLGHPAVNTTPEALAASIVTALGRTAARSRPAVPQGRARAAGPDPTRRLAGVYSRLIEQASTPHVRTGRAGVVPHLVPLRYAFRGNAAQLASPVPLTANRP